METLKTARFDTRWSLEQKHFFEYASRLAGFRTLSEFVLYSIQEQAKKVVEEHNQILASNRDKEVFFNALMNPPTPNENLVNAANKYRETFAV